MGFKFNARNLYQTQTHNYFLKYKSSVRLLLTDRWYSAVLLTMASELLRNVCTNAMAFLSLTIIKVYLVSIQQPSDPSHGGK